MNANTPPTTAPAPATPRSIPASTRWRNAVGTLLLGFGLLGMIGDWLGLPKVKGLGALSCVAPFPKVFSDMNGVEAFACSFEMHLQDAQGQPQVIPITPKLYANLKGPYNRRNVYGAALAGGPILPRALWEPVYIYGLDRGGPLYREFELPQEAQEIQVRIRGNTRGRAQHWTMEAPCMR